MSDTWFEGVGLAESPFAAETESPFAAEAEAPAEAWTPAGAGLPATWPEYEHEADGGLAESPFAAEDPTSAWARAADTGEGEAGLGEAELEADYAAAEDEERSWAGEAELDEAQTSLEGQLEEELGFEPSNPPVNLEGLLGDVARGAAGILGGAGRVTGWFVPVAGGTPPATAFVNRLIAAGTRNQNALTDAVFYAMHPELSHRKLDPGNAWDKDLIRQWHALRDEIVIPALGRADLTAPPIAPAAPPHVTVEQFLADNQAALARFPTTDDAELRLLLTAIIKDKILDVDWGVLKADPPLRPKSRVALVPLVFQHRTGKLIDQKLWDVVVGRHHELKNSPDHDFSPGEWEELKRIRDHLVYPMLRFVLPRISTGPDLTPSSGVGERVAARAHCYLGVRYQWGGKYTPLLKKGQQAPSCSELRDRGEGTLDCQALVNYVYRDVLGREIVHGTTGGGVRRLYESPDFRRVGTPQDVALQPGDLLLKGKAPDWHHVGIFIQGCDVIEAPYTKTVVRRQCDGSIPKSWQLVLRFNEERGGAAEVADAHLRYEDSPSAPTAPSGPFGTLVVDTPGWEYSYRFTAEDVLWTAKLTKLEAGGEDDAPNQAVIWAMFNNWALFAHKTRLWRSFTAFVRAYSTTLQPVLVNVNTARAHYGKPGYVAIKGAGFYKGTDIPRGQLERHLRTQREPWGKLLAATRSLAERAVRDEVPNPGIGNATKFGSSLIWGQRAKKLSKEPTEEQWRRYTQSITRMGDVPVSWIGDVPRLDQKKNAFFLDRRASHLPPNAVRVVRP
jgi:hypothetical protein